MAGQLQRAAMVLVLAVNCCEFEKLQELIVVCGGGGDEN
jgi:hypothetical protein